MVKIKESKETMERILEIVRERTINADSIGDVVIELDKRLKKSEELCDGITYVLRRVNELISEDFKKIRELEHTIKELSKQVMLLSRDKDRMTAEDWYAEN